MMPQYGLLLTLVVALVATSTDAFMPAIVQRQASSFLPVAPTITSSARYMAGFGGSAAASDKKKKGNNKDSNKLKPKQQWDRYKDLKDCDSIRVAAQVNGSEWYEVGAVKSKDNAYTEAAVIRHRALMAEHARRVFPAQILLKDKLEWGYSTSTDTTTVDWTLAGKVESMPDGIDKLIGFKGAADPSGFYARTAAVLSDKTVSSFESMKSKQIY